MALTILHINRTLIATALLLASNCSCVHRPASSPASTQRSSGLLLLIEFYGTEPANWYRVGLSTSDQGGELERWRELHSLISPYFLTARISHEEAETVRRVLAQPDLLSIRSAKRPLGWVQQYVCTVLDEGSRYYLPLGLGRGTLDVMKQLRSAVRGEGSSAIQQPIRQLSFFLGRTTEPSESGE